MRLAILLLISGALAACAVLNRTKPESKLATTAETSSEDEATTAQLVPDDPTPPAAGVDPGMVIKPDSSVDAEISVFTPRENVDPKMIIPGIPQNPNQSSNNE